MFMLVSTNMPVPLLGLLICVSCLDSPLEVEVSSNFVIALDLNLECGVKSWVGQVVLCSLHMRVCEWGLPCFCHWMVYI